MKQQLDVRSVTSAGDPSVNQQVKKPRKTVGFQIADVIEMVQPEKSENPLE